MRATRAYLAGFGTSGSLLAGAAVLFLLGSAIVAFRGWPQIATGPATSSVSAAPLASTSRAARRLTVVLAATHRHGVAAGSAGARGRHGAAVHVPLSTNGAGTGSRRTGSVGTGSAPGAGAGPGTSPGSQTAGAAQCGSCTGSNPGAPVTTVVKTVSKVGTDVGRQIGGLSGTVGSQVSTVSPPAGSTVGSVGSTVGNTVTTTVNGTTNAVSTVANDVGLGGGH